MTTLLLVLLILFLGSMLVLYLTRGTVIKRIRLVGEEVQLPELTSPGFQDDFKLLTNTTMTWGNRIELLLNGDGTYPRLWQDLEAAEQAITLHVYFFRPGRLAERLHGILAQRAKAGVRVFLLLDAFGTRKVDRGYFRSLQDAGVEVAWYRPPRYRNLYKVQQRMHVRVVTVDGRVGYSGGMGIADQWLGDGCHPGQWRDTNVRMAGPTVSQLQVAFCANWAEATGDLLLGEGLFPLANLEHDGGGQEAGIMYSSPSLGSTNAERFFVLCIAAARKRLWITNAYFVPDRDLHALLGAAARRGVDVRVLCPGPNNDRRSAWYAGRTHYESLLMSGVRIYHYRPTMLHAKTLVVDGLWSTVGTFNFDNRSMKLNNEVALVIRDPGFGTRMETVYLHDLDQADEVTLEGLRNRDWKERLKERVAVLVAPLL